MKKKAGPTFVKRTGKAAKKVPDARAGHVFVHGAAPSSSTCYLLGGYGDKGPLSDVWSYDPSAPAASATWQLLATAETSQQSPLPRYEFDGCAVGAGIYVFGGFLSDGHEVAITNDLWVFDVEYGAWQLVCEEAAPPERSGHVVVAVGGGRLAVHGGTCMGARGDLWLYDTATNAWQELPCPAGASPCPRWMHTAAYCADTRVLAVFGGITQAPAGAGDGVSDPSSPPAPEYLNDLWVLDMTGLGKGAGGVGAWRMVQYQGLAPSPRDQPALLAVNGGILIMGGFGMLELDDDEEEDAEDEDDEEEDEEEDDDDDGDREMEVEQGHGQEATVAVGLDDVVVAMDGCALTPPPDGDAAAAMTAVPDGAAAALGAAAVEHGADGDGDGGDDDDDDESIAVTYLDDCWFVHLASSETAEIDPADAVAVAPGAAAPGPPPPPLRGAKCLATAAGILCFGGFDGERFHAQHSSLDATRLRLAVQASAAAAAAAGGGSHGADADAAAGPAAALTAAAPANTA